MSLILDALKKLDREKAFIRKVTANIADEILKADPARPRKKFPLYFAGGLLTVCLTAALTYVVIMNLGFLPRTEPPAAINPIQTIPQSESLPPALEPVKEAQEGTTPLSPKSQRFGESKKLPDPEARPIGRPPTGKQSDQRLDSAAPLQESGRIAKESFPLLSSKGQSMTESGKPSETVSTPAPKKTPPKETNQRIESPPPTPEPAREAQENILVPPAKAQDFAESRKPSPSPVEKKAGQNVSPEGADAGSAVTKKAEENRLTQSGTPPSPLRLTGIVWSEDPSGRYAVINGAILTEGAEIQGIKVVEILPNRVRLLDRGRPFEIQLF